MDQARLRQFQETVWDYYRVHGRDLPWRHEPLLAYNILVSEVMLQQTQARRVVPKYHEFLQAFPNTESLAKASLGEVIKAWSGLGYNRRAKYLHEAANQLEAKPTWTLDDLTACKGIGHNTAAAVLAYAYNQPIAFIETNIRTVYIHHFFHDAEVVSDKEILPLVEQTLDKEHPREFMWALMDYGSHLKKSVGNVARASKHYSKQTTFHGSKRQLRGRVLRLLGQQPYTTVQLTDENDDERLVAVLQDLLAEGLIVKRGNQYVLPN
jgi:A/G-specific adenine glycosylase